MTGSKRQQQRHQRVVMVEMPQVLYDRLKALERRLYGDNVNLNAFLRGVLSAWANLAERGYPVERRGGEEGQDAEVTQPEPTRVRRVPSSG